MVNEREQEGYAALQTQLEESIAAAKAEIENLKRDLEVARVERQHKEEYEVRLGRSRRVLSLWASPLPGCALFQTREVLLPAVSYAHVRRRARRQVLRRQCMAHESRQSSVAALKQLEDEIECLAAESQATTAQIAARGDSIRGLLDTLDRLAADGNDDGPAPMNA